MSSDLVDALQDAGFEPVDSDARGGWASDGEHTLQIVTEHGPHGLGPHEVTVFDSPADSIDIVEDVVGRVRHQSHGIAVRNALQLLEETPDG
ncbi:hypothetical protein, partial [Halorussus halobius]|uniref:hypothetical protein n=1 Tax=Halorussus halobius TaxID=1710537 RepID=UPI001093205E